MIKDLTIYIILAAGGFLATILMSIANGIFLHYGHPDPATYKKLSVVTKTAAFILFLIIGFCLLPILVKVFTDQLIIVIPDSTLPVQLQTNAIYIVYLFWLIYFIGTIIAIPAMQKGAFFAPENPPNSSAPKGALPPLEYQIKNSKIILLANTTIGPQGVVYHIEEIWKKTVENPDFVQGNVLPLNTKTWELMGYQPQNNQQVVCLFVESHLSTKTPTEIFPVINGEITYGLDDPTISKTLKLAAFKNLAFIE